MLDEMTQRKTAQFANFYSHKNQHNFLHFSIHVILPPSSPTFFTGKSKVTQIEKATLIGF